MATRTISQPAFSSRRICWTVYRASLVSVFVIDWMEIGASPPILTEPTEIWRVLLRGIIFLAKSREQSALRQGLKAESEKPLNFELDALS